MNMMKLFDLHSTVDLAACVGRSTKTCVNYDDRDADIDHWLHAEQASMAAGVATVWKAKKAVNAMNIDLQTEEEVSSAEGSELPLIERHSLSLEQVEQIVDHMMESGVLIDSSATFLVHGPVGMEYQGEDEDVEEGSDAFVLLVVEHYKKTKRDDEELRAHICRFDRDMAIQEGELLVIRGLGKES